MISRRTAPVALLGLLLAPAARAGVMLDRSPDALTELILPARSREAPPVQAQVPGPWRLVSTVDGVRTWEAPLPVRPRALFFSRPPPGMSVVRDSDGRARTLKHTAGLSRADDAGTWTFSLHALQVRRPAADGPPEPGEYAVVYAGAQERERALNLADSGLDERAFTFRSLQLDDTTRHGLLLPAPARATFAVTVPDGGVLDLSVGILPPEVADGLRSDGAALVVTVTAAGSTREVLRAPVEPGRFGPLRADLSAWAGQQVELTIATEPGDDATADYVFVTEPLVFTPTPDPPRVVLVFIDTLRADHLPMYGYERQTTPGLSERAPSGAVFGSARSVAPWTLPSARAMLLGTEPELWDAAPRLQDRFAEAGWATAWLAGNVYLSSNFEMADGWGLHRCINWPRADVQVDRALQVLEDTGDRPLFLMLHLMDMHLPYVEPASYRHTFAGDPPPGLADDYFQRGDVMKVARKLGPEGWQYLLDRYDNNLFYIDAQLERIFDALGPGDTVVVLADHGEEFWDHGDFEHGHSLYDELLHIPLLAWGPGFTAGRYDEPVSLIDVAPTLAAAAGLPHDDMKGWPLQRLADGSLASAFAARPVAFGRPLYGLRRWGSLADGEKYTVFEGAEERFDLSADPGEERPLGPGEGDAAAGREALARALGTEVRWGFRLLADRGGSGGAVEAELVVPGGVAAAWVGDDPTEKSRAEVSVDGDRVTARWPTSSGQREVFVVPTTDAETALGSLEMRVTVGRESAEATLSWEGDAPAPSGDGATLLTGQTRGRRVTLGYAPVPLPFEESKALSGFDPEVSEALRVLGYLDEE